MNSLRDMWHTLTAPHAIGVDEARQEYMTKVILVILSAVALTATLPFVIGWRIGTLAPTYPARGTLASLFFVGGWILAHRGHWRLARYIPPALVFLVALYDNYLEGVGAPAMLYYALAVSLIATLKGVKAQWGALCLSLVAYLSFGWAHSRDYLPPTPVPEARFGDWAISVGFALIATALLQWFSTSQLRQALAQARAHATELKTYRDQLEELVSRRTAALEATNQALQREIVERRRTEEALQKAHDELETRVQERTAELATANERLEQEIAERVQTESQRDATLEALRESEEKYRTLFESSSEAITLIGLDGTVLDCNTATTKISGLPKDEMIGRSFMELGVLGEEDVYKYADLFSQAVSKGDASPLELKVAKNDIATRWIEVFPALLRQDGDVYGLQVIISDITERKRAEQALHKKTRQQEHLIETARHLTASLNVKEVLSRIGSGAKEILGADSCAIYLLQEDKETLTPVVAIDPLYEEEIMSTPLNVAASFTGQAVKAKKGMIFNDAGQDPSGQQIPGTPEWDEEHVIVAPFVTDDVVLGAMTLNHGKNRFSEEDLALAETFASYAVTALKNAQTHRDLQREVDERKRAEEALRESETRYRNVVEDQTEFIVRWLPDGTRTFVNGSYCRYSNQTRDELIGASIFAKLTEEDQERMRKQVGALTPKDPLATSEHRVSLPNRKVAWQSWTDRAIFDAEGQILEYQSIGRDITERKRAEAEILRLQHMLQNITDSMPSALIALDPAGRVLTWNPAAEALTGQTATQVQGQSLWQTCPELVRYRELFERVLHQGQVAHRHKEQLTSETETVYRDVDVFPLADDGIEGVVLRIDDVTQRVQLEEMMLQSAKMASVGGLAAGVAHEINNPLGAMIQSAQMLQMAFDTQRSRTRERLQSCGIDPARLDRYLQEHDLATYLDGIRASGARAAKIVSDLLSFSHKGSARAVPHDLNELVEQTLELASTDYDLRKKYDFRNLEIVRELAPDLPAVTCDGQQIQQVILNLVRNAAQAIAGEIEKREKDGDRGDIHQPRLTLRTGLTSTWVRLEVEDNGPGIPDKLRARLFSPFVTTKEVGEGAGLGLWLCWSIVVERHRGRIRHEQDKHGGSRFVVELPV